MPDPAAEAAAKAEADAASVAKAAADAAAAKTAADQKAAADKAVADKAAGDKAVADQVAAQAAAKAEAEKKGVISLKLPEGSLLDPALVEKTAAYAKERGLSQEQAQGLLERESEAATAHQDRLLANHKAMTAKWIEDVKADKEIGGAAFVQSTEDARRALTRFGSEAFRKILDDTGYGNHPEIVRVFAAVGRAMKDDKLVPGTAGAGGSKKSPAEVMYPSHFKK